MGIEIKEEIICPIHKEKMDRYCIEQCGIEKNQGILSEEKSFFGNHIKTITGTFYSDKCVHYFKCPHGCEFSTKFVTEIVVDRTEVRR